MLHGSLLNIYETRLKSSLKSSLGVEFFLKVTLGVENNLGNAQRPSLDHSVVWLVPRAARSTRDGTLIPKILVLLCPVPLLCFSLHTTPSLPHRAHGGLLPGHGLASSRRARYPPRPRLLDPLPLTVAFLVPASFGFLLTGYLHRLRIHRPQTQAQSS